jgi:hypothetical protein
MAQTWREDEDAPFERDVYAVARQKEVNLNPYFGKRHTILFPEPVNSLLSVHTVLYLLPSNSQAGCFVDVLGRGAWFMPVTCFLLV